MVVSGVGGFAKFGFANGSDPDLSFTASEQRETERVIPKVGIVDFESFASICA